MCRACGKVAIVITVLAARGSRQAVSKEAKAGRLINDNLRRTAFAMVFPASVMRCLAWFS